MMSGGKRRVRPLVNRSCVSVSERLDHSETVTRNVTWCKLEPTSEVDCHPGAAANRAGGHCRSDLTVTLVPVSSALLRTSSTTRSSRRSPNLTVTLVPLLSSPHRLPNLTVALRPSGMEISRR